MVLIKVAVKLSTVDPTKQQSIYSWEFQCKVLFGKKKLLTFIHVAVITHPLRIWGQYYLSDAISPNDQDCQDIISQ